MAIRLGFRGAGCLQVERTEAKMLCALPPAGIQPAFSLVNWGYMTRRRLGGMRAALLGEPRGEPVDPPVREQ